MKMVPAVVLILAGVAANAAPLPPVSGPSVKTPRPPLGWNSFDSFSCHLDEQDALANLEVMAKRLKPHGYTYFVVDGGWYREYQLMPGTKNPVLRKGMNANQDALDRHIDDFGRYLPSKTYFPHGMKPIIDRAHALGLKFGIHLMRGIPRQAVERNLPIAGTSYHAADIANPNDTCRWCPDNFGVDMTRPGAQEYYDSWIGLLADWGVDFIKADDITNFPAEIEAIARAIRKTGQPIVFSLSPGGDSDLKNVTVYRVANMVRTTADVWDDRLSLARAFDAWARWHGQGGDGFWPDLDMIPFGWLLRRFPERPAVSGEQQLLHGRGHERMCALTRDQQYTFITMRALAASPLFMGGDLTALDDFSYALITEPQMLDCDQNGIMGRRVYDKNDVEVWRTPKKGDPTRGWIGIFNRAEKPQSVRLTPSDLSLEPRRATHLVDVWAHRPLFLRAGVLQLELPADGVVFVTYGKK